MKKEDWISPAFQKYVSMVAVQDLLKRVRKPDILLLRLLWAPLGVLSGTEELFVFIPPQHESVYVVGGVFQTILVQHPGALGKAHTRQPVVLCYDHIPRFDPVDQRKVYAVDAEIKDLFVSAGIEEFSQIPADMAERKKFADLFQSFNENLEAAKVQGFEWDKPIVIINEDTDEKTELHADFDERAFKVLALRYKELFTPNPDGGENDPDDDVPYAVNSYLTTIDTADIDTDYMNSRFEKYLKIFYQEGAEGEAIHQAETELHKTFATLSQEEQKYANIFLHDIQSGAVVPQPGKTLREYIAEYIAQKQNDQIHKVAEVFGLDEKKLRAFMHANITEANINEFGRFDDLKATVDKAKAKAYFEAIEGTKLIPPKVPVKYDKLLREFIVSGGFDLKMPKES